MNTATALRKPLAEVLGAPDLREVGVRNLAERRQKLQQMYAMLSRLNESMLPLDAIMGQGYYIKKVIEPGGVIYYEVWRKGLGKERVAHPIRVAAMFNPEIFFQGIQ